MTSASSETAILLERLHAGDDRALADILARDLAWLREQVERRLVS